MLDAPYAPYFAKADPWDAEAAEDEDVFGSAANRGAASNAFGLAWPAGGVWGGDTWAGGATAGGAWQGGYMDEGPAAAGAAGTGSAGSQVTWWVGEEAAVAAPAATPAPATSGAPSGSGATQWGYQQAAQPPSGLWLQPPPPAPAAAAAAAAPPVAAATPAAPADAAGGAALGLAAPAAAAPLDGGGADGSLWFQDEAFVAGWQQPGGASDEEPEAALMAGGGASAAEELHTAGTGTALSAADRLLAEAAAVADAAAEAAAIADSVAHVAAAADVAAAGGALAARAAGNVEEQGRLGAGAVAGDGTSDNEAAGLRAAAGHLQEQLDALRALQQQMGAAGGAPPRGRVGGAGGRAKGTRAPTRR
jgi:hypothetical protein